MSHKLSILPSWEEKKQQWEERSCHFRQKHPITTLSHIPRIAGITPKTAKLLKWKSLYYLIRYDKTHLFVRYFFKRPLHHIRTLLASYLKGTSYHSEGDFYYYGLQSEEEFQQIFTQEDPVLLVGFSYCHKPFECPSGRFTDRCIHDPQHPVCGQCFIGKCMHLLPTHRIQPLFIPTIHYIGEKIFEAVFQHPNRQVLFLITACEMTLKMFGDWGLMAGVKGIGVRLDGRICNTMQAFKLSEEGIKPGLTVVLEPTQQRILRLIEFLHSHSDTTCGKA